MAPILRAVWAPCRRTCRACSLKRSRSSSIFIFSASAASGAEIAVSSRCVESSTRWASSVEKLRWCAHRFLASRSSDTKLRSAWPRVVLKTVFQDCHMSISRAWASHSGMGRMASSCLSRYRNVSRAGVVLGGCAVAISRSTKGPKPVRRSSIALPTRSWFVIAMGQWWWVEVGRETSRSTPSIMA